MTQPSYDVLAPLYHQLLVMHGEIPGRISFDNFKYKLQIPQPVRKEDIKLHLNAFVKVYSPILCFNEKNQIRALGEIGTDSSKVALLYIDEGRNEAWSILNMRIQLLQDVS